MFGELLGSVVRIVNAPIRAVETLASETLGDGTLREDERLLSKPADKLAEAFEDIDE